MTTVNSNKNNLITYQQALNILTVVAQQYKINNFENKDLLASMNRTLATDILAPINVPTFNNSAMDGFALQSKLVNAAFINQGIIKLKVTGSIQAGDLAHPKVDKAQHQAWEIMTGAPVPDAFDAILQIENVTITQVGEDKYITITEEVKQGRNIRKKGTDYTINQQVTGKHAIIQSQHIMALATVGIEKIKVLPKVKVAILSTGNELAKDSSKKLNSGKIFNSNQPYLQEFCQQINCESVFVGCCKDNIEDFNQLIDTSIAKQVKIIFSTGAVSMGKYDFIPQVIIQRGGIIHFHKAKIRPGKPILFAELPNGIIYFGLPGNPIAAASGMRFFATPFINKMLGLPTEQPLKAILQNTINSKKGFRTFAKAYARINATGQLCVDMLLDQGSYQSRSFAQSNCWLIIPEETETMQAGELVDIAPMIPNQMSF
ncbi:MAG: molybdopterin molybdotransferase MoeA [Proteobacteria bacterium]|nr:molybdopterin molybdotransferase MoeA [Pseudomonadota bacterium]